MLSERAVAIASHPGPISYPSDPPFDPQEAYPELEGHIAPGQWPNTVYALLRQVMLHLGMDAQHFSTSQWNPLGEIIRPGQKVLIKPNLVRHLHLGGGNFDAVVTHGSLARVVLDYVALALKGQGEITVGDAPVQSADFAKTVERTGLREVCENVSLTWNIPVKLMDFRLWSVRLDEDYCIIDGNNLQGDPAGYVSVNLGERSLLKPLNPHWDKFRVTSYDCSEMRKHHNETTHEYLIPRSVLDADVVINLPKLKTHRKVGLTAALKNMVGINGHKDWLPHHRCGSTLEGGDEYSEPSLLKRLHSRLCEEADKNFRFSLNPIHRLAIRSTNRLSLHLAPDPFLEGSWYGNDTLWRTVLDINRLLVYADRTSKMAKTPQRKCFTIVDGIVAGEGEGPMEPDSRPCGMVVGGLNPVAVDTVLATMIGFDYTRIPLIVNGFNLTDWPLANFVPDDIEVRSTERRWHCVKVGKPCDDLSFKPPSGWKGHIELKSSVDCWQNLK